MTEVNRFWISVERPGGMMDIDSLHLSPQVAARRDPDKFLELADEIANVARKLRVQRSQMEMELG